MDIKGESHGTSDTPPAAPRWLDVELMGHGRIEGRATEVVEFGKTWMRVEARCDGDHLVEVKTINPGTAVFAYSDVSEAAARKNATSSCSEPSHPLYCTACGWKRPGSAGADECPICGSDGTVRSEFAEQRHISAQTKIEIVWRAGAEATPKRPNQHTYDAFEYGLTSSERNEALAWAMAVHRQRAGEPVEVPPRPAFLRDATPEAQSGGGAGSDNDSPV